MIWHTLINGQDDNQIVSSELLLGSQKPDPPLEVYQIIAQKILTNDIYHEKLHTGNINKQLTKTFNLNHAGATMKDNNTLIFEYLTDYLNMKTSPNFAVMIKGEWGSGKTWFIKDYVEKMKTLEKKLIYISLYGLTEISNIDDEIFCQLHPILSSKGMMIAGRVAKGLLKATFKIDLDRDGKEDGSITVATPDIKLPDYLKASSDLLLVFDDIERCNIPIQNTLGYINHLIEFGGYKVILVSNESKISYFTTTEEGNHDNKFDSIKEKVIGKTFQIETKYIDALDSFIDETDEEWCKSFLNSQKDCLISIYISSKYNNLRTLRQSILEFNRITKRFEKIFLENSLLMTNLLSALTIYNIELNNGPLSREDILSLAINRFSIYMGEPDDRKGGLISIKNKYHNHHSIYDPHINKILNYYFSTGFICAEDLSESIANSQYNPNQEISTWERLWDYRFLSNENFDNLLSDVNSQFASNKYKEIGILRHVVGILIDLSDIGLFNKSAEEIIDQAEMNINTMIQHDELDCDGTIFDSLDDNAWGGLGFHSLTSPHFDRFTVFLRNKIQEAKESRYPIKAKNLLTAITTKTAEAAQALTITPTGVLGDYADIPILSFIKPQDFVDVILQLQPGNLKILLRSIYQRYNKAIPNEPIAKEHSWLSTVASLFEKESNKREGTITGYQLKMFSKTLQESALKICPKENNRTS
jgi:hypothetical protein